MGKGGRPGQRWATQWLGEPRRRRQRRRGDGVGGTMPPPPSSPLALFALENDAGERTVLRSGRLAGPDEPATLTIGIGAARVRPGLINAHEHLYLNHYPRLGAPPYQNMYDWGRDVHDRFAAEVAHCSALPRESALRFGALKNLI